ncbi:MarR family winged helix-turn-helix transcriptional regulator [Frigoribacterium sp. MCBA15_019]|jgi:DNA-binding MarR family transcriptional regulator|uniref:MarR family winged helix-turn-helix transcriptional regulator n=1 Tax=Frigoribacterium sp. MCBA15_019 TaxID=1898745 RepID=UPI0008DE3119|nr:MarR family transcriptional regulator [Frigoribacterium sp. MCBA15_019]OII27331.1 MarR family transcriptional regulator [Frigoribacterium sp. MCBA15_019]
MHTSSAARIWSLNHQVLTRVMNDCAPEIESLGLEAKEFFVLGEIDDCPYPAELAVRLVLPKPSVTVYLKNLQAKGFVRREIDPADLRRHRLALTPEGAQTLDKALEILSVKFDEWLVRLDTDEQTELQRLLAKLLN